jgi:hypothetical protein
MKEKVMRSKLVFAALAVALIGLAGSVLAQQDQKGRGRGGAPGGGGGGFVQSRMMLLRIAEVRKELELADEQLTAIEKVDAELREKYPFGGGRGGPGGQGGEGGKGRRGQGQDKGASTRAIPADWFFVQQQGQGRRGGGQPQTPEEQARAEQMRVERNREERAKLAEILLPNQLKRLTEIYVQQAGTGALQDEEIAKELGISDAQKTQIAKVRDDFSAKRREMFQPGGGGRGGGDFEAMRAKMVEMNKAQDEQILAVLSAQQKTKFEEMKGKTFDMPEGAGRGGRGPGGGQGGKGGQRGKAA